MKLSFVTVVVVAGVDGRWKALRDEDDYICRHRSLSKIECQQKTMHNAIQGGTAHLLCQALTPLLLKMEMTYPQSIVYCVKECGCWLQYITSGDMECVWMKGFLATGKPTSLKSTSCGKPEICGGHSVRYKV